MNTTPDNTKDSDELKLTLKKHFPREHSQLMPALHYVQHQYNHLPEWAIETVARHVKMPLSEAYGAASSYSEMRLLKPKDHLIQVCTGLSCRISNSQGLLDIAKQFVDGKTTVDVEETSCGFLCSVSPVVSLDGIWTGKIDPESLSRSLHNMNTGKI